MPVPDNDNQPEENFSFDDKGRKSFASPDGYFEDFSSRLFSRLEREEELTAFPVLAGIPRNTAFGVPALYFEQGAEQLERTAELTAFATLGSLVPPVTQELDAAYSEAFEKNLIYKIELADELKAYPLLHALDKYSGFAIDPSYFDQFADNLQAAATAVPAKQASLTQRILATIFNPRAAFALSCALLLSLGTWVTLQTGTNDPNAITGDCSTIACLDNKEILNDHTIRTLTDDNLFDMVDVNTLDRQLEKTAKVDSTLKEQFLIDNINMEQLIEEL